MRPSVQRLRVYRATASQTQSPPICHAERSREDGASSLRSRSIPTATQPPSFRILILHLPVGPRAEINVPPQRRQRKTPSTPSPLQPCRGGISAAEGFCLRIYSTMAAKSAAASGDQRTVIRV